MDMVLHDIVAKVRGRDRVEPSEALELWRRAPLALLGELALDIKIRLSGDAVFYNRNIHIEPTNVCRFRCRFCSYRREEGTAGAWLMDAEEIERIAATYAGSPITEVHIVGGVHPDFDLGFFIDIIRRVKRQLPHVTVKAFTAVELAAIMDSEGVAYEEGLRRLHEAGMEAIPGGGAEIFDEEVRMRICPEKGTSRQWLQMHETAHRLGISTNATMLYGHIEQIEHRIDHLTRLRDLQDRTGGFNAFIPLKYRAYGNDMGTGGEVPVTEDLRMMALSRIYLDNFPHLKAYWPMFGKTVAELALSFGADDMDGTIGDTTRIYSMAGAEDQRPAMSVSELSAMAASAGFRSVERDSFYNPLENNNFVDANKQR